MTEADRDRLVTLEKAKKKLITQLEAAEELGLAPGFVQNRFIGRMHSQNLPDGRNLFVKNLIEVQYLTCQHGHGGKLRRGQAGIRLGFTDGNRLSRVYGMSAVITLIVSIGTLRDVALAALQWTGQQAHSYKIQLAVEIATPAFTWPDTYR